MQRINLSIEFKNNEEPALQDEVLNLIVNAINEVDEKVCRIIPYDEGEDLEKKVEEVEKSVSGLMEDLSKTNATLKASSTTTSNEELDYSIDGNIVSADFKGYARKSRNLLEGTNDFSGTWKNNSMWSTSSETYNGLVVKERNDTFMGLGKDIYIQSGKTYTFSLYVKASSDLTNQRIYVNSEKTPIAKVNVTYKAIELTTQWQRLYFTFICSESGYICPNAVLNTSGTIYVCGYQLEEGNAVNDYEPYEPRIIKPSGIVESKNEGATLASQITLPFIPLGVGKIKDELIVYADGSGKFIQRVCLVDLGSLSWTYMANSGAPYFTTTSLANLCKPSTMNLISAPYTTVQSGSVSNADMQIGRNSASNLHVTNRAYSNANDFKSAMNGVDLIYELATPTETPLTPSQVAQVLALNTFADVTYIDADGLSYELGYIINAGKAIKDLKDIIKALTSTQTLDATEEQTEEPTV